MIKNLYTDPSHNSYNDHHRVLARLINQYEDLIIERENCDQNSYMGSELWDVIQEQIREIEKQMEWCIEAIDHEKYGD